MSTDDDSTHCFRVADGLRAHVYHLGCNRSDPATILSTQMLHGEFYYTNDDEFYNTNALILLVESTCVVELVAGERKKKRKIPDNFLTPLFCQEVPFAIPSCPDFWARLVTFHVAATGAFAESVHLHDSDTNVSASSSNRNLPWKSGEERHRWAGGKSFNLYGTAVERVWYI